VVCAWERAFGQRGPSLGSLIDNAFKETKVETLAGDGASPEHIQARVAVRVRNMRTLPAMPEIVLRIMKMVGDPNSSAQDMEELLLSDVAIVEKLLQVINSPFFGGVAHQGEWTLKEAIVRMGLKKVGAVAQQVKMMNSFARPEDSKFDLRRFWEHSVGCSMLADKIISSELIEFEGTIEFDDYWIGAILHDIGKLVPGLFFWDFFEMVLTNMQGSGAGAAEAKQAVEASAVDAASPSGMISYRDAENTLPDTPTHETVGQLMLMKSNIKDDLVQVLQSHHQISASSTTLVCLAHLVDNISKDLGMACVEGEPAQYSELALQRFGLDEASLTKLKETLNEFIVPEIKAMVGKCL
jgi:HD-like signal output (HDOD) protein